MNLHLPTLLYACIAALLLAAAVMTWFGWRERCYRGYWWWVGAQWMLLVGLALQLAPRYDGHLPWFAHVLVLQWPISVLTGLRLFYSRDGLPVPSAADPILLALAWIAVPSAGWWLAPPLLVAIAWCAGPLLLQFYAALLVTRLAEFRSSTALQLLAISFAAAASASAIRIWLLVENPEAGNGTLLLTSSLVMMLPAIVLVHVALMLSFRRTEHTWQAVQRKLRYLADMDVLTRLANRRYFQELAALALVSAQSEDASVLMFDIDHFRRINDMFGHASGDDALRQVAQCMRDTLREPDVAGRLGGDEFAILLPGTLPKGAMALASRVVANLATRQVAPRIAPLSLSFGIVQMHDGESIADALRRAEQALQEAKRQGRSRMVVATGSSDKPVFTNSRTLGLLNT